MKYLIVGGVAGGATAAARIRRIDESAEIILFEKGKYISYANCGLPYYIGGVISQRGNLLLHTPETFRARFDIDARIESEVVTIDAGIKSVRVRLSDGSEYSESYDKLLLSPGALPVKPPIEGIETEGIFTLRDINDMDNIKNFIIERGVRNAVVIGAGFIGIEMAENLRHAGVDVSIVEMADQVMAPIDFSMAAIVHQTLINNGVGLYLEEAVTSFRPEGKRIGIHCKSGRTLDADMVILSIGVRPETALAKAAGIRIGDAGGIWVDEYLETSIKDIYAVGDAIEFPHPITGKPWLNYLAGPANRQGRIVADNMVFGNTVKYEGAIGTSIVKVFDITTASTGLPAKRLKQFGIPFKSSWTHSPSHAGYYPNSTRLNIKITFDPVSGRLYGGQCIGADGADKRIDQIALVIKMGGTVYDLMRVEHAYAPPYSSAKDPVAIAGYVADNIISGIMPSITWRQMREAVCYGEAIILDVRTRQEFEAGAIPGAVNIPTDELRRRLPEIPAGKPVYIYCAVGARAHAALRILIGAGFDDVRNLSGGYTTYSYATAPIINKE